MARVLDGGPNAGPGPLRLICGNCHFFRQDDNRRRYATSLGVCRNRSSGFVGTYRTERAQACSGLQRRLESVGIDMSEEIL